MSESTMQTATQLASQYSVQVTDDLESNIKEQERVSAEITALQQQLAALQHDHALLVNMQQALGITSPPAQPATDTAAVPAPRDSAATESAAGKRTRSRKAATAPKRAAAPKPGAKPASKTDAAPATKPAAKSTAKPTAKSSTKAVKKPAAKKASTPVADRPTLVELVRNHLVEQNEPRSAAEVTTALGQANSGRTIKTTVVRTTLEGLVAKNQAQRSKQGTSVYYTATETPEAKQKQEKQDAGTEKPSAQSDN
ncbi:hypothetical protein [Streptomyces thinghirensis]|uniref:Gamma-butyrolactone-binding regulator SlbR n=1 Tax=Streptomyces thinghirensis TaxID=551547 RepID=A0ABP9T1N5_9ACTN